MMAAGGFVYACFTGTVSRYSPSRLNGDGPSDIQRFYRPACSADSAVYAYRFAAGAYRMGNKIARNPSMMLLPFITSCIVLVPRLSAVPQN